MKRNISRKPCLVEREAERFANHKSSYPSRSKALKPTLEEIQSMPFSEYVQHAVFDDNDDSSSGGVPDDTRDSINKRRIQDLRWNHGVVKVTLPDGWWDEAGIAKDRTGRGAEWQPGTKLGDMIVRGPIKQHISGIGGVYEFALLDAPAMTLSEFREKADDYRKAQLNGRAPDNVDGDLDDEACDDLARKFWKRLGPTTPPSMYGADMEGSLFDGDTASGWSLEVLDNCLKLLSADHAAGEVPGVTTPYLYVGMWGSVFCAHTEDMNLLSINYLHVGAPKYWYAIPPEHAKRFESLAESNFVHAARECSEFLRHKQNMISPAILKKAGIPFEVQVQRPGDAIITCPGAYHFGVNLGFNVAEATNFAIPEWIPKGREAKICMCKPHSVRIDVDRFARILARYERDTKNAVKLGFSEIGYQQWVMLEATRRKQNGNDKKPSETSVADHSEKEFWVEVVKPFDGKGGSTKSSRKKKRRKIGSKKSKNQEEEWRLAKPLTTNNSRKKKEQITLETKVLCLLPGKIVGNDDGEDEEDEQCFEGVVKEMSDGHCRVHFAGLKKEEDVWIELNSNKLFLDGGKWEEDK